MTFKELMLKSHKDKSYQVYLKFVIKPQDYKKITRKDMFFEVQKVIKEEPDAIFKLCSVEEIDLFHVMLEKDILKKEVRYIEYILLENLCNNFLVIKNNDSYKIPSDLINYIKMAFNIYDKNNTFNEDILSSVVLGFIRIYNVIPSIKLVEVLSKYNIIINDKYLKQYITTNPKLLLKIGITKYKKEEIVYSLEELCYKDVITLRQTSAKYYTPILEEVISYGKYKINLFNKEVFQYLSFLECNLDNADINYIIDDLRLYAGFDIQDEELFKKINGYNPELIEKAKKVLPYFPKWIEYGNNKDS